VKAPAGLDLGSLKHEEIAVGVLAELVQFNAARKPSLVAASAPQEPVASTSAAPEAPPEAQPSPGSGPSLPVLDAPLDAVDPVCEMLVDIASARFVSEHEGQTYYFCCPACKKKFEADPAKYLTPATA
jgi:xanthine dehydrogenase accessory factor